MLHSVFALFAMANTRTKLTVYDPDGESVGAQTVESSA